MPSSSTPPHRGSPSPSRRWARTPTATIVAWAWDLDDDGELDDAAGPAASATFARPGCAPSACASRTTTAQTATRGTVIGVLNRDPVAAFTFNPDPAPQEQPGHLHLAGRRDPEGRLATEDWDLDGDGAYDDAAGATATVSFASAARAHHRAAGDRRRTAGRRRRSASILPGNETPEAGFTIAPERPLSGEAVTFNATAQDADGTDRGLRVGPRRQRRVRRRRRRRPPSPPTPSRVRAASACGWSTTTAASATAQKTFTVVNRPPVAAFVVPDRDEAASPWSSPPRPRIRRAGCAPSPGTSTATGSSTTGAPRASRACSPTTRQGDGEPAGGRRGRRPRHVHGRRHPGQPPADGGDRAVVASRC